MLSPASPARGHMVFASLLLALSCAGFAPRAYSDGTGWYSPSQVPSGRWEYAQQCGVCHGAQLQGTGAPALKGRIFDDQWNGRKLSALYEYVHNNMPLGRGASVPSQEYADIIAFILAQSALPAGTELFTPRTPMDRVLTLPPAEPSASASAAATAAPGEVKIGALYGVLGQPTTNTPTQTELDAADDATTNWLMYNKGYRGQRYSRLNRINSANGGKLKPVCMFQLGEIGTFSTGPVVYDGILYATTHLGTYAIDAITCRKLWSHQHVPQGPEMNATNKGVALAGGRVIRGTQDGFLYALEMGGRQYVAVASGSSGGSIPLTGSATIVVFGQ